MKKSICTFLLVLAMLTNMTACGIQNSNKQNSSSDLVTFTDDAGRQVEIPAQISKIVPAGPLAQMILFAMEEPKLYQLVFMSENTGTTNFEGITERLGDVANLCVDVIRRDYGLRESEAKKLFEHIWIYTFGIGALCATGMCRFSLEEILQMLGHDFMAMQPYVRSGKINTYTAFAQKANQRNKKWEVWL